MPIMMVHCFVFGDEKGGERLTGYWNTNARRNRTYVPKKGEKANVLTYTIQPAVHASSVTSDRFGRRSVKIVQAQDLQGEPVKNDRQWLVTCEKIKAIDSTELRNIRMPRGEPCPSAPFPGSKVLRLPGQGVVGTGVAMSVGMHAR
jgi:hypothetical protein